MVIRFAGFFLDYPHRRQFCTCHLSKVHYHMLLNSNPLCTQITFSTKLGEPNKQHYEVEKRVVLVIIVRIESSERVVVVLKNLKPGCLSRTQPSDLSH